MAIWTLYDSGNGRAVLYDSTREVPVAVGPFFSREEADSFLRYCTRQRIAPNAQHAAVLELLHGTWKDLRDAIVPAIDWLFGQYVESDDDAPTPVPDGHPHRAALDRAVEAGLAEIHVTDGAAAFTLTEAGMSEAEDLSYAP